MSVLFPKPFCRFLRRHRSKFIFAGVFVGGVYGVIKLAEYKIKDHFAKEQKKVEEELKLQKHFEKVQQHCFAITEAMLESIMEKVKQVTNTEEITQKLRDGTGNKIALWNDLKVMVFCRIMTGLYTVVLVVLVLQVQLNQVAGLMFSCPASDENNVDSQKQKFLSVAHDHLMQHGIHDLATRVRDVVIGLTESMPLQATFNCHDVETTLQCICTTFFGKQNVDKNSRVKLLDFAFPEKINLDEWTLIETSTQDDVEIWTAKTIDILDAPDFHNVALHCISKGINFIGKELNFAVSGNDDYDSRISEFRESKLPLAKLLPILNSQLGAICSTEHIRSIFNLSMLNQFSMNVYESFLSFDL